jgi:hypothetical protein
MKNNENIFIYAALVIVAILFIFGFIPMECHAQTIDMSFGHAFGIKSSAPSKNDIYETKIKISQDVTYRWITVSPFVAYDTWLLKNGTNGNPFNETYSVGIKTTIFDSIFVELNHSCRHQVESGFGYQKYHQERWDDTITMVNIGYHKKFSAIEF